MTGLEKLVEWGETMRAMLSKLNSPSANAAIQEWDKARSLLQEERATADEPLAVMADRKGFTAWAGRLPKLDNKWSVELQNKKETKFFNADTYSAAESAARQYLLALPDKGESR